MTTVVPEHIAHVGDSNVLPEIVNAIHVVEPVNVVTAPTPAPVHEAPAPEHEDPPFDEEHYLKMFDTLEEKHTTLANIASTLHSQPDQDHRLSKVIEFVHSHAQFTRQVCDLLVEIHNFVASRH